MEKTGEGRFVFESSDEADAWLDDFYRRKTEELNAQPPDSTEARREHETRQDYTNPVSRNNREGRTKKKWIGVRMEIRGDSRIYVDVYEGILHPGDYDERNITWDLLVFRKSWYYSWWDGREWQYKPNVLASEAPAGKYYPRLGIRWRPRSAAAGTEGEELVDVVEIGEAVGEK
jgi:hypothetical protein